MFASRRVVVLSLLVVGILQTTTFRAKAQTAAQTVNDKPAPTAWKMGTPIVSYWAGPPLTDAVAKQMADGGWNLVWCTNEKELDVAKRHGLRGQLQHPFISSAALDAPAQRKQLDELIERVRHHPALYSYHLFDEPRTTGFADLNRLVTYFREHDPQHLAYINLNPTYASNEQLGTKGDTATAYRDYLRQYIATVKPALVSYDHYQFATNGDTAQYFLNLDLVREASVQAGLPFLNIVQACSWTPSVRVPVSEEMRYLVYTTLAYGAKGISYYVYCHPGHTGAIALPDGTPTPIYHTLKSLNREFVAIVEELQPTDWLGAYHAGMLPPGTKPLPGDSPFRLNPPVAPIAYKPMDRVRGVLLAYFGPQGKPGETKQATHVLVVNLDYKTELTTELIGPAKLELFDATARSWSPAGGDHATLHLPAGGGKLLRVQAAKK